jgi:hypothetical protein
VAQRWALRGYGDPGGGGFLLLGYGRGPCFGHRRRFRLGDTRASPRIQPLDRLPDPSYGHFTLREPLDRLQLAKRRHTRKLFQTSIRRPAGQSAASFANSFWLVKNRCRAVIAGGFFFGAKRCDVVVFINGERCHNRFPLLPRSGGHHIDHSYPLEKQGNSDGNRRV